MPGKQDSSSIVYIDSSLFWCSCCNWSARHVSHTILTFKYTVTSMLMMSPSSKRLLSGMPWHMHSFTDVQTLLGKPPATVKHEWHNDVSDIVWDPLEHACLLEAATATMFEAASSICRDSRGIQIPNADDVKHFNSSEQDNTSPSARQCNNLTIDWDYHRSVGMGMPHFQWSSYVLLCQSRQWWHQAATQSACISQVQKHQKMDQAAPNAAYMIQLQVMLMFETSSNADILLWLVFLQILWLQHLVCKQLSSSAAPACDTCVMAH